ncbi:MAG TPA: tetratricopeptide repeat protein [Candidatus Nitrosotalea sp.]|nr:tetratricopeptide repeat protein [Candidatus Nitrosotalea sp.]
MTNSGKTAAASYLTAILFAFANVTWTGCTPNGSSKSTNNSQHGPITFNRDIAPIVFQSCSPCHRPGQSAPFDLLTYADARKHATDMAKVTQKHYMPPWLPEPGYGEFVGERRLDREKIDLIRRWVEEGAVEGTASDLPPTPQWPESWQLGKPDLVLQLSPPYVLAAEGGDVYRNFVIPVPGNQTRYVRAVEFHPGNRSVHHVRILIDQTGQSRQRDEQDPEPGFAGMNPPAKFPPGHLLTWTPGKTPAPEPDDLPWILEPDTDLVVQIHMRRTGKTEALQPLIGLYFTPDPPVKSAAVIGLLSQLIDIAPGDGNYTVERTFKLPVDVQVLDVMPHLHYLGKEVQGFATLPDGTRKWLVWIKHWDFNWQGEYRYAKPVFLPKGSVLTMRYTYDNSDSNVHNPSHPPRRVGFGPQSTDEMGELWFQVVPNNANDLAILQGEKRLYDSRETAAFYERFLQTHPDDAPSHVGIGKALGPLRRTVEAAQHFRTALELNPNQPEAHYYLGLILREAQQLPEARGEFESELRINPDYYKACVALAAICIEEQNLDQAETHLRAALKINSKDPGVQQMLARILAAKAGSNQ